MLWLLKSSDAACKMPVPITQKQIGHLALEDRPDLWINGPGNPLHDSSGYCLVRMGRVNGKSMGLEITAVLMGALYGAGYGIENTLHSHGSL